MQPRPENRLARLWDDHRSKVCVALGAGGMLCAMFAWSASLSADPPAATGGAPAEKKSAKPGDEPADADRVSVAVAREKAAVLHEVYASTLHTMHQHYFHVNRAVLPARALEEVFDDMARKSKVKANWISVNTKAMSVDHEPDDEFERQAAAAIASGKEKFEAVENGYYRSASPIRLGGGCVSCHAGFFNGPSKTQRFAGLVIAVPVKAE